MLKNMRRRADCIKFGAQLFHPKNEKKTTFGAICEIQQEVGDFEFIASFKAFLPFANVIQ